MSPSILVKDCSTQQFVKVLTTSSELTAFLANEKQMGVDINSKYLIYKFSVSEIFTVREALDSVKTFGYLANTEYQN